MKCSFFTVALIATLIIPFSSCKKDQFETSSTDYVFTAEELAEINENFCSTMDEHDFLGHDHELETGTADDRGTGVKGKFWPAGQVLRVRFMNGSSALQTKVLNYAKTWSSYANVSFVKVSSGTSEIRVKFGTIGHNSYVGTDNLNISQSTQTMNLQFNDESPESSIRRASLHEFGHALGLMHEHQNPYVNISWDKPKVYAYYATQGWSQDQVDKNVLNKLAFEPTQHTTFDVASIMAYSIPSSLTTNGYSIPWNTELSNIDKEFIGKMYSGTRIRVRHAANISADITFHLNGVSTTLKKNESILAPAKTTGNTLQIWECPSGCQWSSFYPTYGKKYKIVSASNNPNDLKLVEE
jgi:serralysin